jgi:hypothetical protein
MWAGQASSHTYQDRPQSADQPPTKRDSGFTGPWRKARSDYEREAVLRQVYEQREKIWVMLSVRIHLKDKLRVERRNGVRYAALVSFTGASFFSA